MTEPAPGLDPADTFEVAVLREQMAAFEIELGKLASEQEYLSQSVGAIAEAAESVGVVLEDAAQRDQDSDTSDGPGPGEDGSPDHTGPRGPVNFGVLYEWVHLHVATLMERKVITGASASGNGVRWCHQWYRHRDVRERFAVLMLAWEEAVEQPGAAMSGWYLQHYDPQLRTITAPDGPFHECTPKAHLDARAVGHQELAHLLVPDETFPDPTEPPPGWHPGDAPIDPRA